MSFGLESSPHTATIGDTPQSSPETTQGDPFDSHFSQGDDGDVIWHGGEGVPDDDEPDETGTEGETEDSDLLDLFPDETQPPTKTEQAIPGFEPPAQQQAPPDQMPAEFDQNLLDPKQVALHEEQLKSHFERQMAQVADPAARQAINQSYLLAVGALRLKAEYSKMVAVAYQMYQQMIGTTKQLEPYKRVQSARMLAERFGIKDEHGKLGYRKLLKHPRTGEAITDPRVMVAIASMLGEEQRKDAVKARKSVDRPLAPSSGKTARGIADIDHNSKEFEAIERAVASGKHVRLVG